MGFSAACKAHVHFIELFAGDKSPAYHPIEFFHGP
jgi:hypothetical protein